MTIVTARPNSTDVASAITLVGAGTMSAACADDSDGSYAYATSGVFNLGFNEPAIPGTARFKELRLRARSSSGATGALTGIRLSGHALPDYQLPYVPATSRVGKKALSAMPATLWVSANLICWYPPNTSLLYELYIDCVYVAKPTLTVDLPTGTLNGTNKPRVVWTRTLDGDGGQQTDFQVKVFTDAQYGAGGFDPAVSGATANSGVVTSNAASWEVSKALLNDTYRAYVRIAQKVNGVRFWSDYVYVQFTVNVATPVAPTIGAAPVHDKGANVVTLSQPSGVAASYYAVQKRPTYPVGNEDWQPVRTQAGLGLLTPTDSPLANGDFEAPLGAEWLTDGAVARTQEWANDGSYSAKLTYSGTTAALVQSLGGVVPGDSYLCSARTNLAGTASFHMIFADAQGQGIIEDEGGIFYVEGGPPQGIATVALLARAPENAVEVYVIAACSAGELMIDSVYLGATAADFETSNGVAYNYRAQAVYSSGSTLTFSPWSEEYASTWSSNDEWLKHPTRPERNLAVHIHSLPARKSGVSQGTFYPAESAAPVVVSGAPQLDAGELTLRIDSAAERDALYALIASRVPLLLQTPPNEHWQDTWLVLGERDSARIVDKAFTDCTTEAFPWTEVERPGSWVGLAVI